MNRRIFVYSPVLVALMIGACATTPGADDPVMIKLGQMEARLNRIEQAVQNQARMVAQVQSLQGEMRELRGSVEEVQHHLDSNSQRQRNLYLDVDGRLQKLESSASVTDGRSRRPVLSSTAKVTTPPVAGSPGPDDQDISDRDAYQAAIARSEEHTSELQSH